MYDLTLTKKVWFSSRYGRDCIAHKLVANMLRTKENHDEILALFRRYE